MIWTNVTIGRWREANKTLPQILTKDPDWFFWAVENDVLKGSLSAECKFLHSHATAVKLPHDLVKDHCVQYLLSRDGEFNGFNIIPEKLPEHRGSSGEIRSQYLDFSIPHKLRRFDKLGFKIFLKSFKYHWLQGETFTKRRVESFFGDSQNFINP